MHKSGSRINATATNKLGFFFQSQAACISVNSFDQHPLQSLVVNKQGQKSMK